MKTGLPVFMLKTRCDFLINTDKSMAHISFSTIRNGCCRATKTRSGKTGSSARNARGVCSGASGKKLLERGSWT